MPPGTESDARLGSRFDGRFDLVRKLGDGGTSSVYLGQEVGTGRQVALKILNREASNETATKRFLREIEAMRRLSHPNIVAVQDAGETKDKELYLAMELVLGRTLAAQLKQHGPLDVERALKIAAQIADALQAAHAVGVLHRDLKPSNIRIVPSDGAEKAVVLDFAIARFLEDEEEGAEQLTAAGKAVGTPHYMAPEQIATKPLDERCDLYGLGCLLYFMLTGRPPFQGKAFEVMRAHAFEKPQAPSVSSGRPIGSAIDELVLNLLQKEPAARPASAEVVARQIRQILRAMSGGSSGISFDEPIGSDGTVPGLPGISPPSGSPPPEVPPGRQAGLALAGFGVVLAGGLAVLVVAAVAAWAAFG